MREQKPCPTTLILQMNNKENLMRLPVYDYKNLTKQQQDCLGVIESLGIYELRALARVFGDNSPTTLKRNDHIKIVMDKIISGEDLKPIPLRQGRPYKELSNIEGILAELSQITGKDYALKQNQARSVGFAQKPVSFKQVEDDILKQKLCPIDVHGILRTKNDKEFFLLDEDTNKYVLVKKTFDIKLQAFDYVVGTAIVMNGENEYIMDSIKSINFQKYSNYVEDADEYQVTAAYKTIQVGEMSLLLGSRYIFKGKLLDNAENIKKLNASFRENNIVPLAIASNVMAEDVASYQNLGFANILTIKYDEKPIDIFENFTTFVEHIARLQQQGLSLAIFVEDLATLSNSVDFALKNNKAFATHCENAVELVKKLMLCARAGQNDKSTTIFVSYDDVDLIDPLFVSSVYKVSKKLAD